MDGTERGLNACQLLLPDDPLRRLIQHRFPLPYPPTPPHPIPPRAYPQVFYSLSLSYGDPLNRIPRAPNATSLTPPPAASAPTSASNGGSNTTAAAAASSSSSQYRQLLVVEWFGVTAGARLSVVEGSLNTSSLYTPNLSVQGLVA